MKLRLLTLIYLFSVSVFAQIDNLPHTTNFYIGFKNTTLENLTDTEVIALENAFRQYDFAFENTITIPEEKLNYLREQAIKISGTDKNVLALKNISTLRIKGILTENQKEEIIQKINKLSFIDKIQYKESTPVPPPTDIPPTTPSLVASQGYIQANPGVNMQYAWDNGYTGTGINFRDVEYGLNVNHEEFNSTNASIASGMTINPSATTAYTEHGTAAIGVVYADNGSYGTTGLAYGINEAILFPEWTTEMGYNRAHAVSQAVANSVTGDIIMYEMQAYGYGGSSTYNFVPAEYDFPIWQLTKAATDAGIVIVGAGGNGNQNLDSTNYATYMSYGDSGAILVGGGISTTAHSRIYYSTYGSRINVQGWAENVIAPGYGDYAMYGGDFNQQYTTFSGTSSATPIVASCAIVLQSIYHNATGNYLTSQQLRDILIQTGIPQGGTTTQHIGPLPNMQAAIAAVNTLSTNSFETLKLNLYPNPATNFITIQDFDNTFNGTDVFIFNTFGQKVMSSKLTSNETQIDISVLKNGVYWIQIGNQNNKSNLKFIKQ